MSGIFDLPGIDTTGVPLAAVPATQPLEDGTFDRIDLALDPGADLEAVRAAVAGVLGDAYVTLTPTELGLADQRDAEIGIQHAYWALLSPNAEERYAAREFDGTTREQADEGYARYKDTADQAELRIQRVNFVAPDRANVVYRIYYGGSPSPIITDPQNGAAVFVDGKWRIAAATTCQLATYIGQQCAAFADKPVQPPDGWSAADSAPEIAAPFRVVADPDATVDARVAAIATSPTLSPDQQRLAIAAGVAQDRKYSGRTKFLVIGVRDLGDHAQVLYSLTVDGTDGLNTPYPVIGNALHGTGAVVRRFAVPVWHRRPRATGLPRGRAGRRHRTRADDQRAERAAYERAGNEALGARRRAGTRAGRGSRRARPSRTSRLLPRSACSAGSAGA